jgi:hypothetical protein
VSLAVLSQGFHSVFFKPGINLAFALCDVNVEVLYCRRLVMSKFYNSRRFVIRPFVFNVLYGHPKEFTLINENGLMHSIIFKATLARSLLKTRLSNLFLIKASVADKHHFYSALAPG